MKYALYSLLIFHLLLIIGYFVNWKFRIPNPPENWLRVEIGMTRGDVYKILSYKPIFELDQKRESIMFHKREYESSSRYYNKYISKYILIMQIEYNDGLDRDVEVEKDWEKLGLKYKTADRLNDVVEKVVFTPDEEAWIEILPYPRIVQEYHS